MLLPHAIIGFNLLARLTWFMAHLKEHGRTLRFLMEKLEGSLLRREFFNRCNLLSISFVIEPKTTNFQ